MADSRRERLTLSGCVACSATDAPLRGYSAGYGVPTERSPQCLLWTIHVQWSSRGQRFAGPGSGTLLHDRATSSKRRLSCHKQGTAADTLTDTLTAWRSARFDLFSSDGFTDWRAVMLRKCMAQHGLAVRIGRSCVVGRLVHRVSEHTCPG